MTLKRKQTTLAHFNVESNYAHFMTKGHTIAAHMKICVMLGQKVSEVFTYISATEFKVSSEAHVR